MTIRFSVRLAVLFFPLLLSCFHISLASAQEINLDKAVKCGDMLCYQSLDDPNIYYYLPDRPRLAYKDGRPQFSFLKYARTHKTGKAGIGQAEGGGIVHFLVTYGADPGRVKAAERGLKEKYPDATIEGPIIYRKGSFALITSFDKDARRLTRTVAVGKAPLMEGQKAAVSIALTREGAELLWESFKSATPDISIVFDMEFAGVREPYEATLEADWSRISTHQSLKAGMKYAWFGADVDLLFQELEQNGAIKITTRGKNAPMDKILQSAHNKLLKVMFDPAPVDKLTRMQAEKDPYSNLNQAVKMLKMGVGVLKSSSLYPYTVDPSAYVLAGAPFSWKRMLSSFSVTSAYAAEDKDAERRKRLKELQNEMENYWDEKNYELVITKGREVLALYDMLGEDPPVFVYASLGVSNYKLQRYRDALQYFLKLDGMPDEREKRAVLASHTGHCYKKLGDCTSALPYFQKAVKLSDSSKFVAKVYLRMGECAEEQQDYINAVTYYTSSSLLYRGENKLEDSKLAEEKAAQVVQNIYFEARKADDEARIAGYPSDLCGKALSLYDLYLTQARILGKVSDQRVREIESRKTFLARKMGGDESANSENGQELPSRPVMKDGTGKPGGSGSGDVQTAGTGKKKSGEKSAAAAGKEGKGKKEKKVVKKRGEKSSVKGKPAQGKKLLAKNSGKKKRPKKKKKRVIKSRKPGKPGFSLVASYRLRKIKRSGKMVYHMNHYRTETQAFAMAENIGNLYAMWGHDPKVFRAVNIDDPVFKQREILVSLDGQDFGTFSRHINFVTVQMRKRHQSGKLTTDEVVITPESFSKKGNLFTMIYGWKGDDDRQEWLNYHYKVLWSFHGGVEIRSPWLTTSSSMLALQPPFRYRTISIEGQGATLSRAGVRHAVVSITSRVNGKELTTTVTVRNRGTAPSMIVDFPEELEGETATARITWFLKGGKRVESQAVPVKGNILYWDELPGQEV